MTDDSYWNTNKKNGYSILPSDHSKQSYITLMVTLADGSCIIERYNDIGRRYCDVTGQFLTLHMRGSQPITFIGRHLDKLMVGFQHETISHVYCYNEAKHTITNPDTNPPIIHQIVEGVPSEPLDAMPPITPANTN